VLPATPRTAAAAATADGCLSQPPKGATTPERRWATQQVKVAAQLTGGKGGLLCLKWSKYDPPRLLLAVPQSPQLQFKKQLARVLLLQQLRKLRGGQVAMAQQEQEEQQQQKAGLHWNGPRHRTILQIQQPNKRRLQAAARARQHRPVPATDGEQQAEPPVQPWQSSSSISPEFLSRAASPGVLLQVLQHHAYDLTATQCCVAYARLAELCSSSSSSSTQFQQHPSTSLLLQLLRAELPHLEDKVQPWHLAMLSAASITLQQRQLIRVVLPRLFQELGSEQNLQQQPLQLLASAAACVKAQQLPLARAMLRVLLQNEAEGSSTTQCARASPVAYYLQQPALALSTQQQQQLMEQLQAVLDLGSVQQLSVAVWAAVNLAPQLRSAESGPVQQLLQAFLQLLPEAGPSDVVLVLQTGLTAQQHADALLAVFVQKLPLASPQDIALVTQAAAAHGDGLEPPQAQQVLEAFVQLLPQAMPRDIALMLQTPAVKQAPTEQVRGLLEAFLARLSEASTFDIVSTLRVLSSIGYELQDSQQQQLLEAIQQQLPEARARDIAIIAGCVAQTGTSLPYAFVHQLLTRFLQQKQHAQAWHVIRVLTAINSLGWGVAYAHRPQLVSMCLQHASAANTPRDCSQLLWLAATMEQLPTQLPTAQLMRCEGMLRKWWEDLANLECTDFYRALWAFAKLQYYPGKLLEDICKSRAARKQLATASLRELCAGAVACARLGHTSRLSRDMLRLAVHSTHARIMDFDPANVRAAANLCWAHLVPLLLQQQQRESEDRVALRRIISLADACSRAWNSSTNLARQQLYQVHLWLKDAQLSDAPKGLQGILSEQHLAECKAAWIDSAQDPSTSRLQSQVFKQLQQLPGSIWREPPVLEQHTGDKAFSIDVAAVRADGTQLAIEVDGPRHFLLPDNALDGPTQCRNKSLAARGYTVVSIPYYELRRLATEQQQLDYLLAKVLTAGTSASVGVPADDELELEASRPDAEETSEPRAKLRVQLSGTDACKVPVAELYALTSSVEVLGVLGKRVV